MSFLVLGVFPVLSHAGDITVVTVPVTSPANPSDPLTGAGAVSSAYRIGVYDITLAQYATFLNAVAASDPHGLYNPAMATNLLVAGIDRLGSSGHFDYSVIAPQGKVQIPHATAGNRPITYVSWFDAARFANWMSNGQPKGRQTSKTTENGAYNLTSSKARAGQAVARNAVNPNTGAAPVFYLPSENEWYKAAYFNPGLNGGAGGYTLYATNSDETPTNVFEPSTNAANLLNGGAFAVTGQLSIDTQQNYSTPVGSYSATVGPYGTFDMNGSVWEMIDPATRSSLSLIYRGGGWTSFYTYLQSGFRIGADPAASGTNGGFRLISESKVLPTSAPPLVKVGHPGNRKDRFGYGAVNQTFWIGKYEVTIGEYVDFLNAVAKSDPYGLYNPMMTLGLNSAGILRAGKEGSYLYTPMNYQGDSTNRPITYVNWFDAARFVNWMANGKPVGVEDGKSTEDGAYALHGAISGATIPRNAVNPNTGAAPLFFIPDENQWVKAAYYSQALNGGKGGYYRYATKSNKAPGNQIGNMPNMVNYIDDYSGTYYYSVPQSRYIDPSQNYLTDVGAYAASPSYYGTFDQNGNLYQWNDLDGIEGPWRGLRGSFFFAGSGAAQSVSFNQAAPSREEGDTTFRLAAP